MPPSNDAVTVMALEVETAPEEAGRVVVTPVGVPALTDVVISVVGTELVFAVVLAVVAVAAVVGVVPAAAPVQ
jgi:hypothetical protein